jgi:type II secretory pathway component PulJ
MSRSSPRHPSGLAGEAGLTFMEALVALSIMALIFGSIHLVVGNAISAKLMVSNRIADQSQGRQVVEWLADRIRQAGFRANSGSSILRCRNGIVSQDSLYYPTASSLSITADLDNSGTAQTRTFKVETVAGRQAVTESVTACVTGATTSDQAVTDTTSVQVQSLTFAYYDVNGTAVTNLTSPAAIQSIRTVQVTVVVRALLGKQGPTDQTWTTEVALRNP